MSKLIENIFGKNLENLQVEDLIEFFEQERKETFNLEFKSGGVSLEKIYSEISAFLNTGGGILIIGTPDKNKKDRVNEIYQGELIPTTTIKSEQSLIQLISSYIAPAPLNIDIKSFDYKKGKIFVLEIPQSKYPPHQNTTDGKYYVRFETESVKAPHAFISALFNQRQFPDLALNFTYYEENGSKYLTLSVSNNSIITAERVGLILDIYGILHLKSKTYQKRKQKGNITYEYDDPVEQSIDRYHFTFRTNVEDLVKGLSIQIDFLIVPCNSNFLISTALWSKNSELKHFNYVIDNKEFKAIYKDNEVGNIRKLIDEYKVKIAPNLEWTEDAYDE